MAKKRPKRKGSSLSHKISPKMDDLLMTAFQHHQAGRIEKAEALYKQIIQENPNHPDALHLLGVVAYQKGDPNTAIDLIKKAIAINSKAPQYKCNLGNALREKGVYKEAIDYYRQAIKLHPDFAEAYNNLGATYRTVSKPEKAIECYKQAIRINPYYAGAYNNLGNIFREIGEFDKAIENYKKAIKFNADYAEAYNNLGNTLNERGDEDEAIECFRQVIEIKPSYFEAHNNLGFALNKAGRSDEAVKACRRAIGIKPDYAEAYNNMGIALNNTKRHDEAITVFRKALEIKPDFAEAYHNLGITLDEMRRFEDAIAAFKQAINIKPDFVKAYYHMGVTLYDQCKLSEAVSYFHKVLQLEPGNAYAYNHMGLTLALQGNISESISCFEKALELKPDYSPSRSNILFASHYAGTTGPDDLFVKHREWAARCESPIKDILQPHPNDRSPARRLRIGYESPDFRTHSVAYFIKPILASHNRSTFEIFCYSDVEHPDSATTQLKKFSDNWRDIHGMPDDKVEDLIRGDKIDILVDLAGHTGDNRMALFARKSAPVQVTYLGYPDTTGLDAMDYKITDSYADPSGMTEHLHSEELVRLKHCFLCYIPSYKTPDISPPPVVENGKITFGSFNNRAKITPDAIGVWAEILHLVPDAKLILKAISLSDDETRKDLIKIFSKNDISPDRIKIFGFIKSNTSHLEFYNKIDIALDTFPYNGTTTTCEAMCMGVPVIVLEGDIHVSRVGVSILSNVGMGGIIAHSKADYIQKAVDLAGDIERLKHIRTSLRDMMAGSPLMDAHGFTRNLEEEYRKMWSRWCGKKHNLSEDDKTYPSSILPNP